MSFRVVWSGPAERDLARLPARAAIAVITYVDERLAADPHRLSKPLQAELAGRRSARNGDYRVLLRLDDETGVLSVLHVDHRAHVYRPR